MALPSRSRAAHALALALVSIAAVACGRLLDVETDAGTPPDSSDRAPPLGDAGYPGDVAVNNDVAKRGDAVVEHVFDVGVDAEASVFDADDASSEGYYCYSHCYYDYDGSPYEVGPPPPFPYDSGPPWDGGSPVAILTGQPPTALAVNEKYVYFGESYYMVDECPVSGCPGNTPTVLADNGEFTVIENFAAAASRLYYIDNSTGISACASGGCGLSPSTYLSRPGWGFMEAVVTDSSNVYFWDDESWTISSCPLGATCSLPYLSLATVGGAIDAIAASPTDLYFAWMVATPPTHRISSVPIGGGKVSDVCDSPVINNSTPMVVSGGYVYFTGGGASPGIYACPASSGGVASVFVADALPVSLAADGSNLYWANSGYLSTIASCPLGAACSAERTVASGQDFPQFVAVNSKSVFWATATSIYAAAK